MGAVSHSCPLSVPRSTSAQGPGGLQLKALTAAGGEPEPRVGFYRRLQSSCGHNIPPPTSDFSARERRAEERGFETEGGVGEGVSTNHPKWSWGGWGCQNFAQLLPTEDSLLGDPALSVLWWIGAALEKRVGGEPRKSPFSWGAGRACAPPVASVTPKSSIDRVRTSARELLYLDYPA